MQANNVRYVTNLRGSLHYLLVKMEAERQVLIAKLFRVREQAVALLNRIRAMAVPVDEIIPARPCSHRKYRELRKVLSRPVATIAGLLPACCDMPYPKFSNRGDYVDSPVHAGEAFAAKVHSKSDEVAAATAALKAKRAAIMAQQAVNV
jgi:hypothetical protein